MTIKKNMNRNALSNAFHNDICDKVMVAVVENHISIVKEILPMVNDKNKKYCQKALMVAIELENIEILKELVQYFDVNFRYDKYTTPLCIAAAKGNNKIVEILLNNNAKLNYRNNEGVTPLIFAAEYGHLEVVDTFLARGACTDYTDPLGRSPLWIALSRGYWEVAKNLISMGADINHANNAGQTPLMVAVRTGGLGMVRNLLEHGAYCSVTSHAGSVALDFACKKANADAVCGVTLDLREMKCNYDCAIVCNEEMIALLKGFGARDYIRHPDCKYDSSEDCVDGLHNEVCGNILFDVVGDGVDQGLAGDLTPS